MIIIAAVVAGIAVGLIAIIVVLVFISWSNKNIGPRF